MGKNRIIAETGAGQHGVATATVCARFGLECVVYMGAEDMRAPGPQRVPHEACSAPTVQPVTAGTATLKDAINEAMRDWVTNVRIHPLHPRLAWRARIPTRCWCATSMP
jgi:tryptophan synthase beta chain